MQQNNVQFLPWTATYVKFFHRPCFGNLTTLTENLHRRPGTSQRTTVLTTPPGHPVFCWTTLFFVRMHEVYISTLILTWFCLHTLELHRTLPILIPIPEFLSSTKRLLTNKLQLGLIKKKTHTHLLTKLDWAVIAANWMSVHPHWGLTLTLQYPLYNLLHLEPDAGPTHHVAMQWWYISLSITLYLVSVTSFCIIRVGSVYNDKRYRGYKV